MRRVLALLPLLLTLLLAAPAANAATPAASPGASPAATPEASPAASPASDTLPGLEYVAARQYAPAPTSPIGADEEGLFVLTVRIYRFDTEAHADGGWDSTVESTAIETELPSDSDKVTYEEQALEGLGDRAWATILSAETPEGDTGFFRLIYVQEGAYLYTLSAIAGSADATLITDDIARGMVEREPGSGDVRFNADGTSTGGVWDLLPAAGDESLGGIVAFADAELDLGA